MRRAAPDVSAGGAERPLDGMRVLDMTAFWAGPVMTSLLGDMGADVVIAVHPGWAPGQTPPDTSWDLASIIMQGNYILTWSNTYPDLAAADIPITVPLPDIPLYDLTRAETAIEAGRKAVDGHLEALRPLALSEYEYTLWRASIGRRHIPTPVISRVAHSDTSLLTSANELARQYSDTTGLPSTP